MILKIHKYVPVIIFLLSIYIVSCDDFIDIAPTSNATVQQAYKTDSDFKNALVGVYNGLRDPYNDFWEFGDLRGDDVKQGALRQDERVRVDNFVMDPSDDLIEGTWEDFYNGIYRINLLLSKIKETNKSTVPNKNQYEAEAKFIRALIYFNLVRIWGEVPIITTPITIDDAAETGRGTVKKVYEDIIIKDLQEAQDMLPNSYEGSEVGRATKGAATALLGKVYLTRQNFGKAETELQKVTTMGYSLLNSFKDVFDFSNEHTSEYIFDIEYIGGGQGLGSDFTYLGIPESQDVGGTLSNAIKDKYNIQGRGGGGTMTPSQAIFDIFGPKDLRKSITAVRGLNYMGEFIPVGGPGQVDAFTKKYLTAEEFTYDSNANWKVIRYADVLLMYAEALNENGKISEALDYLNMVHKRAGLEAYSDLSQVQTRKEIYLERRRELFMEGSRWFDLVRTERAYKVMKSYGMKPYQTVFPIPQDQIDVINDPSVFEQNEGY